ncbi:MAG: glycosyltransferase family 4 protein [Muribaculaceae bacterium]|nr:glycosyltransferase family 4 protein [Muribaculaceae bacterium]
MNILFLSPYCTPEYAASSYLGRNRCEAFAANGFTMVTYAPTPCRGISEEERQKYKKIKFETLYNGFFKINRFSMFKEPQKPLFRAFRYSLCWMKHLYYGMKEKNVDVVFLSSTPPIQGMIGALLNKWRKIPFIYNLQDVFPDSLLNNGIAKKNGFLWKIGRLIEDFTYKNADKVIVISEDFKKNIMAKGVPEEKIAVIYNWVDQNAVVDIPREKNKLFDLYGLNRNKFYITYNGNIGLSQNMDMLMDVAESLQSNPDIQFVLVGDGAYIEDVKKIVAKKQLDNVHLLPFQPYEDISLVFSLGDVSLVISKPGTGSASVPSKTWSIMSASRPVLANFDENELKEIINKHKCGIFTKAGDKDAFINAILKLYHNRELCNTYGKNGRKFVLNNLTREIGTQKYVDVMKSIVKK